MFPARALSRLAGVLYPALCRSCGGPLADGEALFCRGCMAGARRMPGAYCGVCCLPFPDGSGGERVCHECAAKRPPFSRARAPYMYGGAVKDAIHLFKYERQRAVAGFLAGTFRGMLGGWFGGAGVVAAVPLHPKRLRARGFNQSLLLAVSAAEELGAVLSIDGLVRTRDTRPQVELGPGEREKNVRGAFGAARPEEFAGRSVLLVDDVYTTGATVRECARVLRKSGAREVFVLTVARASDGPWHGISSTAGGEVRPF